MHKKNTQLCFPALGAVIWGSDVRSHGSNFNHEGKAKQNREADSEFWYLWVALLINLDLKRQLKVFIVKENL